MRIRPWSGTVLVHATFPVDDILGRKLQGFCDLQGFGDSKNMIVKGCNSRLKTIPSANHGCPSEMIDSVGSEDQEQGDGGYGYFAEGSNDEGAGSLFEEVF